MNEKELAKFELYDALMKALEEYKKKVDPLSSDISQESLLTALEAFISMSCSLGIGLGYKNNNMQAAKSFLSDLLQERFKDGLEFMKKEGKEM